MEKYMGECMEKYMENIWENIYIKYSQHALKFLYSSVETNLSLDINSRNRLVEWDLVKISISWSTK